MKPFLSEKFGGEPLKFGARIYRRICDRMWYMIRLIKVEPSLYTGNPSPSACTVAGIRLPDCSFYRETIGAHPHLMEVDQDVLFHELLQLDSNEFSQ